VQYSDKTPQDGPSGADSESKRSTQDGRDDLPVIPDVAFDDTDAAWGEYPQDSDEWLRSQRPPHHGG
jgi:hypothetical protein